MKKAEILSENARIIKDHYGLNNDELNKLIKKVPSILYLNKQDLTNRAKILQTYKFKNIDIKELVTKCPSVLVMNDEDLKEKLFLYTDLNFRKADIISNPTMLSTPVYAIKIKYMLSKIYNMQKFFFPFSNKLGIQALSKTYARLEYFKTLPEKQHVQNLFITEDKFIDKYSITFDKLKSKYFIDKSVVEDIQNKYNNLCQQNFQYPELILTDAEKQELLKKDEMKFIKNILAGAFEKEEEK